MRYSRIATFWCAIAKGMRNISAQRHDFKEFVQAMATRSAVYILLFSNYPLFNPQSTIQNPQLTDIASFPAQRHTSSLGGLLKAGRLVKASDPEAIKEAAQVIRRGGLVAFPTETVYGLGADACNPMAVARIFEVKNRPRIDPLIIHVADAESARLYGEFSEGFSSELMRRFWPGPLTLVVQQCIEIPPIVTAGLGTVAIRVPRHAAALALIRASGCAIAAPSANPFGYVSPTEAYHVAEQLADKIDLILDGGPCTVGVESTILSLVGQTPCILRSGGVTIEELESIVGKMGLPAGSTHNPEAPGQLRRHYATETRLEIAEEKDEKLGPGERIGLLSLTAPNNPKAYISVEVLSQSGDLREAAANLFAALRRLDTMRLDRLIARPVPERGLGTAIMDRLRRCSAQD